MRNASALAVEEPDEVAAGAPGAGPTGTLVVVGNGMVSHRLCRQLVEYGGTGRHRVIVFGEEPVPAYDRIRLAEVVGGRAGDDLLLAPHAWYADHGIDLRLGDPVVTIDRARRTVTPVSGRTVRYTRLVLATGSAPIVPRIEGADLAGVCTFRTLADVRTLGALAREARTAVVIGGGLLGLEAARALQDAGLGVTVIEAAASVMPAQLDQDGGQALERQIAGLGIEVLTGARTKRIAASGRRRVVHLAGGERLTADLVVIATGVRPRTELAARCNLARCPQGGVIVNDHLRTSDPHIWAIGDCASHGSRTYGIVAPGYAMADTLASILSGRSSTFSGEVPATTLDLLGVHVASVGEPLDGGDVYRFHRPEGYRLIRIQRGRLAGAMAVGEWPGFRRVREAAWRQARVWPWQLARFERTGELWRQEDGPVAAWPARTVVCACLRVTRGQIAACADRAATVDSIAACTGASTVCGSCRPLIAELAHAGDPGARRVSRPLLAASLVALTAAATLFAIAPFPVAASIQEAPGLDVLWRHRPYREISGLMLVALTALASLLTLRKRWPRAAWGTFPAWRMAHVLVGALTLAVLAVHTGARPGDNLNFALMASFGTLNVLGGLAGGITAIERRVGARAGRVGRAALVLTHIVAVWPLPILIAFHVLATYYF